MIDWTSLKRNKYFKFLILITIIGLFLGIFLFFKIKNDIDISELNIESLLKNNFSYHIIFFSLIFFFSFLFLGFILGIIIYEFEIISYTILFMVLMTNLNIKGIILAILILVFRLFYYLLLIFISFSSFKISRSILSKQNHEKEKFIRYLKQAITFSVLGILLEIFNYTIGYKLIMFFTNLL